MRTRITAMTLAAGVLAAAGLIGVSSPDAGAASLSCGNKQYFTGSAGHAGGSLRCTGGAFVAVATCYKPSYGNYTHYGNRVETGGTSTVWCDLGATITELTGRAS